MKSNTYREERWVKQSKKNTYLDKFNGGQKTVKNGQKSENTERTSFSELEVKICKNLKGKQRKKGQRLIP